MRWHSGSYQFTTSVGAVAIALMSVPAFAQEASSDTGTAADEAEEIIVTARLRSETLVDVPVSISVIGEQAINRAGAVSIGQIAQLTPQVNITRGFLGGGANITIRGMGSSSSDAGIDASVAVAIDNVLVNRGTIATQGFFDLQQVEVLKGPQSLFFGKNATGGVISLKSADPTSNFEAGIKAGYEFEAHEAYAEGYVSGPLTDTLGARLALRGSRMTKGWVRNVAVPMASPLTMFDGVTPGFALPGTQNPSGPRSDEIAGRLTLVYEPTDDFTAKLKVMGGHTSGTGSLNIAEILCPPGQALPFTNNFADIGADCRVNGVTNIPDAPPELVQGVRNANGGVLYEKNDNWIASLNLNKSLGDLSLTSVSGYQNYYRRSFENSFSSIGINWGSVFEKTETMSQELRLDSDFDAPVNFLMGGYWEHTNRSADSNFILPTGGTAGGFPLGGASRYNRFDPVGQTYADFDRFYTNKRTALSAFGQIRWQIVPTLEFDAGVRYTRETQDTTARNLYVHPDKAAIFLNPNTILSGKFQDSNFSPEITLSWKPAERMNIFASYKTGFKSGGFSNSSLGPSANMGAAGTAGTLRFNSEKARGFEVGYKGELADGRLNVSATAYTYKFEDLQVSTFVPPITYLLANVAAARIRGVEFEAKLRPMSGLNLRVAASYNDAKYLKYPGAPCYSLQQISDPARCVQVNVSPARFAQDLSGRPLVRAPAWNLLGGVNYDTDIGGNLGLSVSADATYTSSQYTMDLLRPDSIMPAFWLFDASARLHDRDDTWELALVGRNLFNKRYYTLSGEKVYSQNGSTPAQLFVMPQRTRSIALQVSYKFK